MKKILTIIYIIGFLYFLLPAPKINPQVVGYRSQEPGDTGQVPNIVAAYYTNQSRKEILDSIQKQFKKSCINFPYRLCFNLPTYQLIHPPEYSKKVIRQTHHSWHFVELIHWQRESLFVSFWEPALRNKSLHLQGHNFIQANHQHWQKKVTFYYQPSNWLWREIIWTLEVIAFWWSIKLTKNLYQKGKKLKIKELFYEK